MVDEKTINLLKIINEKCSPGSYQIIAVDEILEDFPARYGADNDLVRRMISYLSGEGYISVRYDRDGDFCLSITSKGRLFVENASVPEKSKKRAINGLSGHFWHFLTTFFAVFSALLVFKAIGGI